MTENELANIVIGLAIKVHKALGPGLLESAYKECLYYEIVKAGLNVEKEIPMPLIYEGVKLECGFRADLRVEKKLIIDTKSVMEFNEIFLFQTLTYLKLSQCKLGLIINFNVIKLKEGIRRVINGNL